MAYTSDDLVSAVRLRSRLPTATDISASEILGIADQTGSLDAGKRADILITSAPLLASDARVLRVLADGETLYQDR